MTCPLPLAVDGGSPFLQQQHPGHCSVATRDEADHTAQRPEHSPERAWQLLWPGVPRRAGVRPNASYNGAERRVTPTNTNHKVAKRLRFRENVLCVRYLRMSRCRSRGGTFSAALVWGGSGPPQESPLPRGGGLDPPKRARPSGRGGG